jgi:hypothetical protein
MPGMLTENTPPPSSGPTPTPPAATPGAGAPPSGGASGPEHSGQPADVEALKEQAIQMVYGERFEQLIEMFQTNGAENFPRSMAIAVNTAITEMEKTSGDLGPEVATEIGVDLFGKLLEDMLVKPKDGMGAVVEGVTAEQLQEVLPAILVMYGDSHPNVSKTDIQAVMAEVDSGVKAHQAGGQSDANQTPDGASVPPNAANVPPNAANVPPNGTPPGGAM